MEDRPEYTEFGIKIHKLRLTLKVHKRQGQQQEDQPQRPVSSSDVYAEPVRRNTRRRARSTRTNSTASSLADSLRQLDLDPAAGSRKPCQEKGSTRLANWEFQGFYSGGVPLPVSSPGMQTMISTPSSGYSSAAVSRTSSFSIDPQLKQLQQGQRSTRLSSADDSVYSEVYSTIDELSELQDPFDEPNEGHEGTSTAEPTGGNFYSLTPKTSPPTSKTATMKISHSKTASNITTATTSTLSANSTNINMVLSNPTIVHSRQSSQIRIASVERLCHPSHSEHDFPPPLPPRISTCRPPARPPYPSSIVRAVQEITKPLER